MNKDDPSKDIASHFEQRDSSEISNILNNSYYVLASTGSTLKLVLHKYLSPNIDVKTELFAGLKENEDGPSTSAWTKNQNASLKRAVEFLHEDKDFLVAAEIGNSSLLQFLIRKGTNIQQIDHLGRNALHLAVCSDNEYAVIVLLRAGVLPNRKDNLGMTPLSLCLMRRPSLKVAELLFDYGAEILPRSKPMDTGLFLQFVMMCTPTAEEARILELLTTKGALMNDPEAPGGRQALHFAAMSDNCPLIRILIDLGADMYLVNHRNETPKEVALTFKCKNAYSYLNEFERMNESSSP